MKLKNLFQTSKVKRNMMTNYLRALWKHWVVLASGVGSLVLAAISTRYPTPLPGWTFWLMTLACFFVASFCEWRDGQTALLLAEAEIQGLSAPKYATEQLQRVRDLYGKQDKNTKDLLREIRVCGSMLESQATTFYRERGVAQSGILHALEYSTNLICKALGDQYCINPELQAALDAILTETHLLARGKPEVNFLLVIREN
jgi:hypothetical protein